MLDIFTAFDLKTKTLNHSPAFSFSVIDINLSAKATGD
jgi:hypothetical protein